VPLFLRLLRRLTSRSPGASKETRGGPVECRLFGDQPSRALASYPLCSERGKLILRIVPNCNTVGDGVGRGKSLRLGPVPGVPIVPGSA
jgi:hypothetical protein